MEDKKRIISYPRRILVDLLSNYERDESLYVLGNAALNAISKYSGLQFVNTYRIVSRLSKKMSELRTKFMSSKQGVVGNVNSF